MQLRKVQIAARLNLESRFPRWQKPVIAVDIRKPRLTIIALEVIESENPVLKF